jgi:hypothetical protein
MTTMAAERSPRWYDGKRNLQVWVEPEFSDEFKAIARHSGRTVTGAMREALAMWAYNARLSDLSASIAIGRQADELLGPRDEERIGVPA